MSVVICAAFMITLTACGTTSAGHTSGNATPKPSGSATGGPTPEPTYGPEFTAFLIGMSTQPGDPGYSQLRVRFGLRNSTDHSVAADLGTSTGTLTIREGRTYQFPIQNIPPTGEGLNFILPPHAAVCGTGGPSGYRGIGGNEAGDTLPIEADGQIPTGTNPTTLAFIDPYQPSATVSLDLTAAPQPDACTPDTSNASLLPADIAIGQSGSTTDGTLHLSLLTTQGGKGIVVQAKLQNNDKLDPLSLDLSQLWALDDHGNAIDFVPDSQVSRCNYDGKFSMGPGQSDTQNFCYYDSAYRIRLIIFEDIPTSNDYTLVAVP
jgi:hypothetical protein